MKYTNLILHAMLYSLLYNNIKYIKSSSILSFFLYQLYKHIKYQLYKHYTDLAIIILCYIVA